MTQGKHINDQEFRAVLALAAPQRYEHFVKQVADWGQVWSLRGEDGWVLAGDHAGHIVVPVWPHERYAAASATDAWAGTTPAPIELQVWMERWLPGIERDQRLIGVFPTPTDQAVEVTPARLRADLDDELSQYE